MDCFSLDVDSFGMVNFGKHLHAGILIEFDGTRSPHKKL
jgi:hypothetical protein